MFLSELEPGTKFKLTDAALKAERARLRAQGYTYPDRLEAGPFTIMTPQRRSGKLNLPPELWNNTGGWFTPSFEEKYEVEVIPQESMGETLPARSWLFTSADPEVFIERDGKIVPGFSVLPPKKNPGIAYEAGGRFHEDGFQAEFSPLATACHETVAYSMTCAIGSMMGHMNDKLHYTDNVRYKISDANFVELSPELLSMGTDDQVALGCDTSENVWGHPAFAADNAREFPFRMAGGHIHLGTVADAKWFHSRAERIIRAMDVFLGVPSVALLAGLDDPRRRQFYGRAGEFRFQKHGLEYRVLSNAWLQHPSLTHLVWNLARGAFRLGTSNWEDSFKYDAELVRHIINDYDVQAAQKFVEENAKILIWIMNKDAGYGWGGKALTTIHQGAKKIFGDQLGIQKNWVDAGGGDPTPFHRFVARHSIKDWGGEKSEVGLIPADPYRRPPTIRANTLQGLDAQLASQPQAPRPAEGLGGSWAGWANQAANFPEGTDG